MRQLVRLNKRVSSDGSRFTYVLRYVDSSGKRRWETLGHSDKRKAEKQRTQKERELRIGHVDPASMRLSDFLEDSLAKTGDHGEPLCGRTARGHAGRSERSLRELIVQRSMTSCSGV